MSAVSGLVLVAVLGAGAAAALLVPSRPRIRADPVAVPSPAAAPAVGWMLRFRPLWCVLAGLAGAVFVGGQVGPLVGAGAAVAVWVVIGRAEPPAVRRAREQARADLPHVVGLLGSALRAGASTGEAVAVVCAALPGAAAQRLSPAAARLALGADPVRVWESLAADDSLGPLGRALARAHTTGVPVVRSVERLADELAATARADVEDRARAVGVKAALPLGLCLLPAFVLVGIVPLVAGLLATVGL
ncbi:type II secretion system F family protein [Nocardioides dongkuii]|uniref:type II secretion system F family protein n=1 Tax=Nocardioides dongkuii TaxID=2760089 RepID=UPI001FCFE25C|nr:type II secretion system F family protein [Nocardioides dongkuii]